MEVSHGVIYIDAFFMVNFLMDFLLLLITAGMTRLITSLLRLMTGALSGAGWAVFCVLVRHNEILSLICGLLTYTGMGIVMVRIVFGKISWKNTLRTYFILVLASCCTSGIINFIGFNTMLGYSVMAGVVKNEALFWGILLVITFSGYLIYIDCVKKTYDSGLCQLDLNINGKIYRLSGLIDSGNRLMDPIFGNPVHVISRIVIKDDIPEKFHLIPYHSVGNEQGIIQVVFGDSMTVYINGKSKYYEKPEIALYDGKVSSDNEYDILLHSETMK